ncbi:MAG: sulfatase/phosphatase domain-containing protein, partial [Verrucomicrobiota bacterium]
GIPQGESFDYTYIHDLYATSCDASQITPPENIDSRSLLPMMREDFESTENTLFLPFQDNQRAVSDGKWKLHVYPLIDHTLLFDMEKDPHENQNLATDPAYAPQIKKMQSLMEKYRTELGDPYPITVDNPDTEPPHFDNSKRNPDKWQPKWIREKYFDGREYIDPKKK